MHKIHALLHSLHLEIGTWPLVCSFLESCRSVTTDFGTEAGLAEVEEIDLAQLFPWGPRNLFDAPPAQPDVDTDLQPQPGDRDDDNRDVAACAAEDVMSVPLGKLFPLALQVPGALRILHHAVEQLTGTMPGYCDWFLPRLQAVVRVLKRQRFKVMRCVCVCPLPLP